ncbi:MAG: RagB/SusD family nutrient uptake outer membrane protein [Muribaculaceae bacterium]|nr:RagB/SusD family nutrient uptake outer membrane protein [Muribaculaceae bacterium]MDE6344350.1 RagB/SusD family nutrient uptake outer membrane protein [Muribaculaceae bacterium]MDE6608977.1 RagB/SusD family nutrient uptake outer membrane protein [Muribaculaceae bacterium]
MKKSLYLSLFAAGALMLSSCEDLDIKSGSQMDETTFWQTDTHLKQGIMGAYNAAKADWAFSFDFTLDQLTDLYDAQAPHSDIVRGVNFTSTSGSVQNYWTYLYEVVHRANTVIRNVQSNCGPDVSDALKQQVTGEAKFLRAMAYFRMLNFWGGVPYYDESCVISTDFQTLSNPRETAETIRGHIIDDLTDAIGSLPVKWDDADYGRATKGAAVALRGKVYLYNSEWDKAKNDFAEIVNNAATYGYALESDFDGLFRHYGTNHGTEIIFGLQGEFGATASAGLRVNSYIGSKSSIQLLGDDHMVPSPKYVDMFENKDGSKFKWSDAYPGHPENFTDAVDFRKKILRVAIDAKATTITDYLDCDTAKVNATYTATRDPRLAATVITPYSTYLGSTADMKPMMKWFVLVDATKGGSPLSAANFMTSNNQGKNAYFCRKLLPTGNLEGDWHGGTYSPYEFPIIRYADVLLMLSECYNELGDLNSAVTELNKVRARVNMPGLNSGASWLTVNTKADMTQRIRDERAYELGGEGQRYFDLKRWGILGESINDALTIYGELYYTREFQERQNTWPIPNVAIERNPNLVQNTGW